MNQWTAEQIKNLRLRLGWSAADFSRRFGCDSNLILDWERGVHTPSPNDIIQFQQLEFYLNNYCEQVSRGPAAEQLLKELKIEQIHLQEINQYKN